MKDAIGIVSGVMTRKNSGVVSWTRTKGSCRAKPSRPKRGTQIHAIELRAFIGNAGDNERVALAACNLGPGVIAAGPVWSFAPLGGIPARSQGSTSCAVWFRPASADLTLTIL